MKKILTIILFLPCVVLAAIDINSTIESVIKEHRYEREGFNINHVVQGSIIGHKNEVKVVQWTLMGASYWKNYITIIDMKHNYKEITTKQVYGIIESIFIDNNTIFIESKEKGPNDANCCPSVKVTRAYKLDKGSIIEVK